MDFSRRDFTRLALAGIPLVYLPGAGDSKINGVRIGVQSYSFRTLSLDDAIKAMKDIGIGECELFAGHVEPARPQMPRPAQGSSGPSPEARAAMQKYQDDLRTWRLTVSMDHFKQVRKKFDDAGVMLQAYNLSFNDRFSDEEIDRGFLMAKTLGVKFMTASSTLSSAKRLAPFADKHKMTVAMHNHDNTSDPNEFAKPETFEQALALSKYFAVNLDIGHFVAADYNPIEFIEKHHSHITNLHLKDRKKTHGANLPWGQGDTPIKEVLNLLKKKKYDIPANIEFEYPGDAVAEVRKCFQYCKEALA